MSSAPPISKSLDYDGEPVVLPSIAAQYEKMLSEAYSVSLAAVRNEDTATGEWVYNSTQEDVEIFTKKPAGSTVECSKGIGFIDAPPLLVSILFNSPDWRPQWDGMHDRGERLDSFDPLTNMNYNSFKAPWPVSGRDFIAIGRTVILPPKDVPSLNSNESKGIGALFTFSINCESPKMPPKKGLVRGVLHFCGLWVEAVPGNPNRSKVIYTLGSDPCGSIPKSIVNAANVKQPLCIAAIRNVLKKNPKLRGEVEKKIEGDKLKFREWRNKNGQGAAVTAAPVAVAAAAPPAAAASSAPAEAEEEEESASTAAEDDTPPPSVYDAALNKAYNESMAAVRAEGATDGWVFNSRQENIDIFMKSIPGSTINCCKGVGFLDFDAATVELAFNNNQYRHKWDEILLESKELKIIDWKTSVAYSAFGAPWPVSARDFLAVGRSLYEPLGPEKSKGVLYSYSTSISDDKIYPNRKGYIRGTLHWAGLWIEPVGPNRCKVIYTLKTDPNGSIPKAIVNGANVKQPLCIATVGKFIAKSPDIIAKMREVQKQELADALKMKQQYLSQKKGAKKTKKVAANGSSAASAVSASASPSLPSPSASNQPTIPPLISSFDPSTFQFSDPAAVPYAPVVALLRANGPPSLSTLAGHAHKSSFYVEWDKDSHINPALHKYHQHHADLLGEIEGLEASEERVSMFKLILQLLLNFILSLFKSAPEEIETDEALVAAAASTPLVGMLWVELLDLRQLVITLQTQHMASLQAERSKDKQGANVSLPQKVWIQLELINDVARQGQVSEVHVDLATGAFACYPSTLSFRVTNPEAKLSLSIYTQSLDVVYPSQGPAAALQASQAHAVQTSTQSVSGKLRNAINPLTIGSSVASGLESGFDSFLHVFETKGSAQAADALAAAKGPRPVVLMGQTTLHLTDLVAPTAAHSKLGWVALEDMEGLNGPSISNIDELMVHSARRIQQMKKKDGKREHHPLLQTLPIATYSLLLHSYYRSHAPSDFRASFSPNLTRIIQKAMPRPPGYAILFQTLDGVFDIVQVDAIHRPAALYAYEKLKVGVSTNASASRSRDAAAPILVSKCLISPDRHLLAASYFDAARKKDLLSFAKRLLRSELVGAFHSIDDDVLQSKRSVLQPSNQIEIEPAVWNQQTQHVALDPRSAFSPFLFVSTLHAMSRTLPSLVSSLLFIGRVLSWKDVYVSFFVWVAFVFTCFYPSFLGLIAPFLIVVLAQEGANSHFSEYLTHHGSHVSVEFERKILERREKFLNLVAILHSEVCEQRLSKNVVSFLYFLQNMCQYLTAAIARYTDVFQWHHDVSTMALLAYLGYVCIVTTVFRFEFLLVFIALSIAFFRSRIFQTWLGMNGAGLQLRKRLNYIKQQVKFPATAASLSKMAQHLQQQRK